jgi:hypothetical protein
MVLQNTIADPELRDKLVSVFNDKDENNTGIEKLKYKPQVMNNEVGTEIVADSFEKTGLIPGQQQVYDTYIPPGTSIAAAREAVLKHLNQRSNLRFSEKGKVVSAAEAVRLIRDGDTVATGGFGFAEEIALALGPTKTTRRLRAVCRAQALRLEDRHLIVRTRNVTNAECGP